LLRGACFRLTNCSGGSNYWIPYPMVQGTIECWFCWLILYSEEIVLEFWCVLTLLCWNWMRSVIFWILNIEGCFVKGNNLSLNVGSGSCLAQKSWTHAKLRNLAVASNGLSTLKTSSWNCFSIYQVCPSRSLPPKANRPTASDAWSLNPSTVKCGA
jgi:hypothetical protein